MQVSTYCRAISISLEMNKLAELMFIPSPGIGHLVSTLEIAKHLVSRDDQFCVTFLIMHFPPLSKDTDAYVESFANSSSPISHRIKFIHLPQVSMDNTNGNGGTTLLDFVETQKPHAKDAVAKIIESTTRLAGFVVDMFCTSMIDVSEQFGIPSYVYFTSGAGTLGLMFHLQALRDHDKDCIEFKDSNAELIVPSFVNPVPAKVLPGRLLVKESAESFLNITKRFRDTKGILVNTFTGLESHALLALSSDSEIPPIYPVGPLLNLNSYESRLDSDEVKKKQHDISKWLDDQPPLSVVFLCFGSGGSFGEDQVKEIANALEHTGHRFLWSLRQPPPKASFLPSDYDDITRVLPKGFLDRTNGIGKVIGWAPQVTILAHPSVGGFVSHCGWNSTLESLWHGVPVATWPLYAEQQLNAFELVKELGLAVEIDMSYRSSSSVLVSAKEIERGIREVMELDSHIRKRVKEMSEMGKKALKVAGSSYSSLGHFIDQMKSSAISGL